MTYQPKNYKTDGGDKWVIRGVIDIQGDGKLTRDGEEFKDAEPQFSQEQVDAILALIDGED